MTSHAIAPEAHTLSPLDAVFTAQHKASREAPYIPLASRMDKLKRLQALLADNHEAICEAISTDFGHRPHQESLLLELTNLVDTCKFTRKRLKKWAKPQKRHVDIMFFGAKNTVIPQSKGVIGVVAPWNYPLTLSLGPCISAIAAGNRCMVKLAANSQNLARLLAKLISEKFDETELAIMPGVSAGDFTSLSWDHLVFTGSPEVGKIVMRTCAEKLIPVTLELGGKSPTIIADDFDLKTAAERLLLAKFFNASQTCVAPDYLFVPRAKVDEFVELAKTIVSERYPTADSQDFTSIIDERAYTRLSDTLTEAVDKGAKAIPLTEASKDPEGTRKFTPHVILDSDDSMRIMQEEIFGPMLPIKPYDDMDEVIRYINEHERPLALYLYSNNKKVQEKVLYNTLSGGVCLNDSMLHVGQHDMPFGGVGNSGLGHYHGYEGFVEFSKMRPVFKQARFSGILMMAPPYGKLVAFMIKHMLK